MAQEHRPSPARQGQKRQQGAAIFCSNYDLNCEVHEDVPYRVYEYQTIPPLIKKVPAKIRRTLVGLGVKNCCSPHKASRNSRLPPGRIKSMGTEELQSIRRELSRIKAQVDRLLESLEHMDQRRDQRAGIKDPEENRGPARAEGSSHATTESPAHPEADSSKGSTDKQP